MVEFYKYQYLQIKITMKILKKIMCSLLCLWSLLTLAEYALATETPHSIVGNWQTIDHKKNKPSSLIKIWEQEGEFFGTIVKVYPDNTTPGPERRCLKCQGYYHDKSLLGVTIIKHLVWNGDDHYTRGKILNPLNGKFYHCQATLLDGGRRLKLLGYIGFPFLGRTDIWIRVDDP